MNRSSHWFHHYPFRIIRYTDRATICIPSSARRPTGVDSSIVDRGIVYSAHGNTYVFSLNDNPWTYSFGSCGVDSSYFSVAFVPRQTIVHSSSPNGRFAGEHTTTGRGFAWTSNGSSTKTTVPAGTPLTRLPSPEITHPLACIRQFLIRTPRPTRPAYRRGPPSRSRLERWDDRPTPRCRRVGGRRIDR